MDSGSGPTEAEGPGDVIPGEAADMQSLTMTQEQPRAPRASLVVIQVWVFLSFNHHPLKSYQDQVISHRRRGYVPGKDHKLLMGRREPQLHPYNTQISNREHMLGAPCAPAGRHLVLQPPQPISHLRSRSSLSITQCSCLSQHPSPHSILVDGLETLQWKGHITKEYWPMQ